MKHDHRSRSFFQTQTLEIFVFIKFPKTTDYITNQVILYMGSQIGSVFQFAYLLNINDYSIFFKKHRFLNE